VVARQRTYLYLLAVIELDDAAHERRDRKAADEKIQEALTAAGVQIIRVRAKALPDEDAIRAMLADTPTRT
jgi:very-short-patch-repair endonuclease